MISDLFSGALKWLIEKITRRLWAAVLRWYAGRKRSKSEEPEFFVLKGDAPYDPEDGKVFRRLRRRQEIERIAGWVLNDQIALVLIVGEAGVGKTSLVRAGLGRHLKTREIPLIYWDADPQVGAKDLISAIRAQWDNDEPLPSSLEDLVRRRRTRQRAIVLDHVERLSLQQHPELTDILGRALLASPPCNVTWILVVNSAAADTWEDFFRSCGAIARSRTKRLDLVRFPVAVARHVVMALAEVGGLRVQQRVLDDLVDDLVEDDRVSPLDVGITVRSLSMLAESQYSSDISPEEYREIGRSAGLYSLYIQNILSRFSPERCREISQALKLLVDTDTGEALGQGLTVEELFRLVTPADRTSFARSLEDLAPPLGRVLLENPDAAGMKRYRLAHRRIADALPRLSKVLSPEAEQARKLLVRAYKIWKQDSKNRYLLGWGDLKTVWLHKDEIGLESNPELGGYIEKSRRWLRRKILAPVAFVIAGLGLASLIVYFLMDRADIRQKRALLKSWDLPPDLLETQEQLETLGLSERVNLADWLTNNLRSVNLSKTEIETLQGVPQNTCALDINSTEVDDLAHLPPRLEWLDARFIGSEGLQELWISGLPPTLKYLYLGGSKVKRLGNLPGTLETLTLEDTDLRSLQGLPPGLKRLRLAGLNISDLDPLPDTIQELELIGTRVRSLQKLPRSLRSLKISSNVKFFVVDTLPPFLTSLDLEGAIVRDSVKLPDSLTSLRLRRSRISSLKALPESVTTLVLDEAQAGDLRDLPPRLTALALYGVNFPDLSVLPGSLTALEIVWSSGLDLRKLPLSLRSLRLDLSPIERLEGLPDIAELYINGTKVRSTAGLPPSLNLLQFQWAAVPSLARFPAGLQSLDLGGSKEMELLEGLPPHLESLNVSGTKISSVQGLPASLKVLDISRSQIRSLKGLPSRLGSLTLSPGQVASLEGMPATVRALHFVDQPVALQESTTSLFRLSPSSDAAPPPSGGCPYPR